MKSFFKKLLLAVLAGAFAFALVYALHSRLDTRAAATHADTAIARTLNFYPLKIRTFLQRDSDEAATLRNASLEADATIADAAARLNALPTNAPELEAAKRAYLEAGVAKLEHVRRVADAYDNYVAHALATGNIQSLAVTEISSSTTSNFALIAALAVAGVVLFALVVRKKKSPPTEPVKPSGESKTGATLPPPESEKPENPPNRPITPPPPPPPEPIQPPRSSPITVINLPPPPPEPIQPPRSSPIRVINLPPPSFDKDWQKAVYYKRIRISDDFFFQNNGEIREIFGKGNGLGTKINSFKTNFDLPNGTHLVWCPILAIKKDGEFVALNSAKHINLISADGNEIYEALMSKEGEFLTEQDCINARNNDNGAKKWFDRKRITFAKSRNQSGRNGYKFVGIFKTSDRFVSIKGAEGVCFQVHERISCECNLPTP